MTDSPSIINRSKMSPWPIFIAMGFALSEVGILFGLIPLTIGGILLFGGSCGGILQEIGYSQSIWRLYIGIGMVFAILGGGLTVYSNIEFPTNALFTAITTNGIALRGLSILISGAILVITGFLGEYRESN